MKVVKSIQSVGDKSKHYKRCKMNEYLFLKNFQLLYLVKWIKSNDDWRNIFNADVQNRITHGMKVVICQRRVFFIGFCSFHYLFRYCFLFWFAVCADRFSLFLAERIDVKRKVRFMIYCFYCFLISLVFSFLSLGSVVNNGLTRRR